MQCFRISIHSAAQAVTVRPALLQQIDLGSLICAQIRVCAIHMKEDGGGGGGGGQACTRVDLGGIGKLILTLPHQEIEPSVSGFEFRHSNH